MQTTTTRVLPGISGNAPTSTDGLFRAEIGHTAYGITFLPWDDRIHLLQPAGTGINPPQFRGCLPGGEGSDPVPVFDLRSAGTARGSQIPEAPAFLLIVSVCQDDFRVPMNVGLLVTSRDGCISPLPRFVFDHCATN